MDLSDEDQFENQTFGLHSVLASTGVDPSSFSNFFGQSSSSTPQDDKALALGNVELEDNEDKYEDDVNVDDGESPEERKKREEAKRRGEIEEIRWRRKFMEMQRDVEKKKKEKDEKVVQGGEVIDEKEMTRRRVMSNWPEFKQGERLRMSDVFYETPKARNDRYSEMRGKRRKLSSEDLGRQYTINVQHRHHIPASQLIRDEKLPVLQIIDSDRPNYDVPLGEFFDKEWIKAAKAKRRREIVKPPDHLQGAFDESNDSPKVGERALDLIDWEKDLILDSTAPSNMIPPSSDPFIPFNIHLQNNDWLSDIIWDASRLSPDLIAIDDEDEEGVSLKPSLPIISSKLDRFNISNDHLYEHSREQRFKIRQTFGAIEVFHSAPARTLQLPYYKTILSKTDARAWKRPAIQFPTGIPLTFSKLRSNPSTSNTSRKKAMLVDPSERFKSTKDLTMAEKGPYVLLEFSEEYPPIMSGYGMGTTIVNYYRKKDDKDSHVPSLDFGQPSILNPGDGEPYLLGYVDRGKTTQIIHNNLIRAPIFKHTPPTTDFLVIRHTVNGHASYHIRPISNVFTVGQTMPHESEVAGPHARKNTNYAKTRLQIVAWLLINKSKAKRIKMGKLLKYFPEQTELQMRQRLKIKGQEFLLYNRQQGPNQGYWSLNPAYPQPWPTERSEVLLQATPEQAMLYESMQVGARHLYDAGYTKTAEGKDEEAEGNDENGLDIEQKLAVWSTTLNYKRAEQQKAWLVVHGEGDPTGRGEGWSFLRGNMKGYFLRNGETEQGRRLEQEHKANGNPVKISNAEQNRIYEEEKRRIWDIQSQSLSDPVPPELEESDLIESSAPTPFAQYNGPSSQTHKFSRSDSLSQSQSQRRAMSRGNSVSFNNPNTPGYYENSPVPGATPRDYSPAPSQGGDSSFTGNVNVNKVMRIKRLTKSGKVVTEIIRDQAVIASYRRRVEDRKIEEFRTKADDLRPTGNAEEDELRRAALLQELDNMKKNQLRRMARKKYSRQATHGINVEDYDPDLDQSKRRCGACGQLGHTKANRNCPMFNQSHAAQSPISATPGPGGIGGSGGTPMDYFTPQTPGEGGTPSLKIKLGMGGQK